MNNIIRIIIVSVILTSCIDGLETIYPTPGGGIQAGEENCNLINAFSTCLTPLYSPEYYIEQGVKYFQTMQSDIPINVVPNYSDKVVRYEWPPWLIVTGYERNGLILGDILLKLNPTSYDLIDCRYFEEQPFCRCHVVFNYGGELCPIYEEFTFNDQGEMTFIEAWSDYESLLPMNAGNDGEWDDQDYWALGAADRLSTRVPGLGNDRGMIAPASNWMQASIPQEDLVLRDMVRRLRDPINTWLDQLIEHQEELNGGCEVPEGDIFPYYEE